MSKLKEAAIKLFRRLPFRIQARIVRNQPGWAFYVDTHLRELRIDYFLGKYSVLINPARDLERRLISGSYEPHTLAMIRRFVGPNQNCIDIGANVGAIAIALADACGPNGTVHAFEPGPIYCQKLRNNLELNPELMSRVRVHAVGLSDSAGQLSWQDSEIYIGTASMYRGVHNPHSPTVELPVVRLDDYPPLCALSELAFIKLDVDGLELQVLKGGIELIKKYRPVIYVETTMWNEEMTAAAQNIELLLNDLGYDLYKIDAKTFRITRTRFPDLSFNTLAIPCSR